MERNMPTPEITVRVEEQLNEVTGNLEHLPVIKADTPNAHLGTIVLTHPDDLKLLREAIDRCLAELPAD
ncbi:MAG: hypothetical protein NC301_07485 [Bacteroides sp.]|nr:hypothetical protein [Bacteroides sp.]MCM1446329.1 hypothetical protein [Prevotella sp.]